MAAGTLHDIANAVSAIIDDIEADATRVISIAPSHFGTDFRITPGEARYQDRIVGATKYGNSNDLHRRATVVINIHHYVTGPSDESYFHKTTMGYAADRFLDHNIWEAESGILGLEPDTDVELSDGERVGNVITFEFTASVILDAA
jgi:hypothetical protein